MLGTIQSTLYSGHMNFSDPSSSPEDIRCASFDEFVRFLFDRDAPSREEVVNALRSGIKTEKWPPWHFHVEVAFDPHKTCQHYSRLFLEPKFLLERFSKDQLEQGFWAIQGPNLECSASRVIWDRTLPFDTREEVVRSMFYLFRDLFFAESLYDSVSMWWDSLCYGWHCGNRKRERGGEDLRMQDVMFETLSLILAVPSEICQGAALHGLSHLHHPKTEVLITKFIDCNPSLTEPWRNAALAASRFELM